MGVVFGVAAYLSIGAAILWWDLRAPTCGHPECEREAADAHDDLMNTLSAYPRWIALIGLILLCALAPPMRVSALFRE